MFSFLGICLANKVRGRNTHVPLLWMSYTFHRQINWNNGLPTGVATPVCCRRWSFILLSSYNQDYLGLLVYSVYSHREAPCLRSKNSQKTGRREAWGDSVNFYGIRNWQTSYNIPSGVAAARGTCSRIPRYFRIRYNIGACPRCCRRAAHYAKHSHIDRPSFSTSTHSCSRRRMVAYHRHHHHNMTAFAPQGRLPGNSFIYQHPKRPWNPHWNIKFTNYSCVHEQHVPILSIKDTFFLNDTVRWEWRRHTGHRHSWVRGRSSVKGEICSQKIASGGNTFLFRPISYKGAIRISVDWNDSQAPNYR